MRKRHHGALALFLACGLAAPAAVAPADASGLPRRGGTFRISAWTEPENLNPLLVQNGLEREISRLLFLDPVFYDSRSDYTTPLLAELPTRRNGGVSKDGRTWTLKLKRGVRWHDGTEVTSADFRYSFERAVDPKVEYPSAADMKIVERVETPDAYTAVYRLARPAGLFNDADKFIVPRHLLEKSADFNRDPFGRKPVGNGPFEFVEWVSGSHIVLRRRSDAPPDGPPWLDRIIFQFVPDENTRWVLLRSGGVDWHRTSTQDIMADARRDPRFAVHPYTNINWTHLAFNLEHPVLSDRRVREAIVRAIDKEEIAAKVSRQKPIPIYGLCAPTAKTYTTELERYAPDPERARRLLDAAGWKPGRNGIREKAGKPLKVRLATLAGSKPWAELQLIFADYLKRVGIEVAIESHLGNRFYGPLESKGILNAGDFDLAILAWGGGSPNLLSKQIWHSSSIPPAGSNFYRYRSAKTDALLDRAEESLEYGEQMALQKEAQRVMLDDLPCWPLYVYEAAHVATAKLRNYDPGSYCTYIWNAKDWWLEE